MHSCMVVGRGGVMIGNDVLRKKSHYFNGISVLYLFISI
jgi:hypothetical protein